MDQEASLVKARTRANYTGKRSKCLWGLVPLENWRFALALFLYDIFQIDVSKVDSFQE